MIFSYTLPSGITAGYDDEEDGKASFHLVKMLPSYEYTFSQYLWYSEAYSRLIQKADGGWFLETFRFLPAVTSTSSLYFPWGHLHKSQFTIYLE